MAITKTIAIRDRLDKRINYAVNGEKTTLDAGITYVTNPEKTEQHFFTSALNCESCETAYAEMQATKRRFGKLGGVIGYHFIQSFAPGEVTPEQAHAIGVAFARRLFGDRYEVVIGTHLDKAYLHNHVVVNSVSFVDGKKYHSSPGSYYFDVRGVSDALCRENDLSTIAPQGKGKHYAEWKAEQNGKPTIRSTIRADIDRIIGEAYTYETFLMLLRREGYVVQNRLDRKYVTVLPPGGKLAGLGAKNLAALLVAVAKDNPKLSGKTGLKRLIQDGEELTIFSVKQEDLKGFQMESKRYGVLFYPIINRVEKTGTVEIMAKAKDAQQINRIFERMGYPAPVHEDVPAKKATPRARSESSFRERGNGVKTSTEMDKPSVRAKMLELKKVSEQMVRQARAVPVQENEQIK